MPPEPNKKISSPDLDACSRNVSCTGEKAKNSSPSLNPGSPGNSKEEEKITLKECVNPCATKAESPKICKGAANEKKDDKASAKAGKKCKSAEATETKECKTTVKEKQAVLNKEPCPPSPSCQMARPELPDAKARVDKAKPGCIDYESCEDEEGAEAEKDEKQVSGCMKYEDCKDLENEEKTKLEKYKESQTQNKKEKATKDKEERPCPKKIN